MPCSLFILSISEFYSKNIVNDNEGEKRIQLFCFLALSCSEHRYAFADVPLFFPGSAFHGDMVFGFHLITTMQHQFFSLCR